MLKLTRWAVLHAAKSALLPFSRHFAVSNFFPCEFRRWLWASDKRFKCCMEGIIKTLSIGKLSCVMCNISLFAFIKQNEKWQAMWCNVSKLCIIYCLLAARGSPNVASVLKFGRRHYLKTMTYDRWSHSSVKIPKTRQVVMLTMAPYSQ